MCVRVNEVYLCTRSVRSERLTASRAVVVVVLAVASAVGTSSAFGENPTVPSDSEEWRNATTTPQRQARSYRICSTRPGTPVSARS